VASRFGEIYLRSLIASAEQHVDLQRSKGRRLRVRIAERRLRKLQAYEAWRGGPVGTFDRRSLRPALVCVSVLWIVLASLLGVVELRQGSGAFSVTILLVSLLVLTAVWFQLAVLCVPANDHREQTAPQSPPAAPPTAERRRSARGDPMPVFEYLRVAETITRSRQAIGPSRTALSSMAGTGVLSQNHLTGARGGQHEREQPGSPT